MEADTEKLPRVAGRSRGLGEAAGGQKVVPND